MYPKVILASSILIASLGAQAEILVVDEQPTVMAEANTPERGMHMSAVIKQFGQPASRYVAPGKVTRHRPRITVWTYNNFKVIFERALVLHTVVMPHQPVATEQNTEQ